MSESTPASTSLSPPPPPPSPPPSTPTPPTAGQLFHQAATTPISHPRIDEIRLEGLVRTRPSTVLKMVDSLHHATSLIELRQAALTAESRLQRLGIFRGMRITFDEGPLYDASSTTALVKVQEVDNLLGYRLQTFVTAQGRTGAEAALKYKNITGRADALEISAQRDAQRDMEAALHYVNPTLLPSDAVARFRLFQCTENFQEASSYTTTQRGFAASAKSFDGVHEVEGAASWREVYDASCSASRSVMNQKGHYIKQAIKHVMKLHYDNDVFECGVRLTTELAGMLSRGGEGVVRHFKHHAVLRGVMPLGDRGVALHVAGEMGLLIPLFAPQEHESMLCERFFPGGVPSLRGFARHGVGPVAPRRLARIGTDDAAATSSTTTTTSHLSPSLGRTHDALGFDFLLASHASLSFPVASALRGHVFVDAATGALHVHRPRARGWSERGRELADHVRVSIGAGILLPTALGNLEVNVVHLLKRQELDHVSGRIQFGLTVGDV